MDIILWDAEDYGQPADSKFPEMEDSYCLGSQYWAKNMHHPNYMAKWGILLDMCGALGASFSKEQQSVKFAGNLVDRTRKMRRLWAIVPSSCRNMAIPSSMITISIPWRISRPSISSIAPIQRALALGLIGIHTTTI